MLLLVGGRPVQHVGRTAAEREPAGQGKDRHGHGEDEPCDLPRRHVADVLAPGMFATQLLMFLRGPL